MHYLFESFVVDETRSVLGYLELALLNLLAKLPTESLSYNVQAIKIVCHRCRNKGQS
jgi:hypothetical protein